MWVGGVDYQDGQNQEVKQRYQKANKGLKQQQQQQKLKQEQKKNQAKVSTAQNKAF